MKLKSRNRTVSGLIAAALIIGLVTAGGAAAHAVTNPPGASALYAHQVFYTYVGAGETLDVSFIKGTATGTGGAVAVSAVDPEGNVAFSCTIAAGAPQNMTCSDTGLASLTAGVWTIEFSPSDTSSRYGYDISVRDAGGQAVTGRTWVTRFEQYQSGAGTQPYWIATREGYLYGVNLIHYGGAGSALRSNGFGLVEAGTCTPIYRSAEGTAINANGVPLEAGVEYSTSCGDDFLLFLEQPAADLPATAPAASGEMWIRPQVVPPAATNLEFTTESPFTRAGEITFDLAGVNGGYSVQIDTNGDGDYVDEVDRIIPWGSPPGAVTVPFDGLDGQGAPVGVCQPMNARVVVDRVGEMHLVLEDVEQLGNAAATQAGIRLTGLTTGISAPSPLLYWDDRNLNYVNRQANEPFDGVDGRAGFDTTTLPVGDGAHGWRVNWGDMRSIENWTYYQATAGAEVAIEPPCSPAMTLDKRAELGDANANGRADVGETIDYSFLVRNTGNSAISGVTVTDPHVTDIAPSSADLAVGQQVLFTAAPYAVTQEDVDAGQIVNTAFATGVSPLGEQVETPPDSEIVLGPDRAPALTLDKRAQLDDVNANGRADVGETIDYSFVVTNTGNVTVSGVSVDDPHVAGITPFSVTLAPGASQAFTAAPYTVVQADANVGSITNTAVANGTAPTGPVQSPPDTEIVLTPDPDPRLVLDKTGALLTDADGDGGITPGDTVRYTFEVRNAGTVDLVDVTVQDPHLTGPLSPSSADIVADGTATFTGDYIVVQSDLDAGVIRNTATAVGTYQAPGGDVPVQSAPDSVALPTAERTPALEIVKTGSLDDSNGNGFADAGETITYDFDVTNTGNTTLANVVVVDERFPELASGGVTLAPGTGTTVTSAPYMVTQADVDAGGVSNVAVARGNVPGGAEVVSEPDDEFIEGPPSAPGLTLEKSAALDDANANGVADAGETIVYSFTLLNTGNVTLFDVAVDDPMLGNLVPEPLDLLSPATPVTVSAEPYTVTPGDVAAGEIVNVALARALLADGSTGVESQEDAVTLPARVDPGEPSTPGAAPSGGQLPSTGGQPPWTLLGAAFVVLLLGGGVLVWARLRTRRPRDRADTVDAP